MIKKSDSQWLLRRPNIYSHMLLKKQYKIQKKFSLHWYFFLFLTHRNCQDLEMICFLALSFTCELATPSFLLPTAFYSTPWSTGTMQFNDSKNLFTVSVAGLLFTLFTDALPENYHLYFPAHSFLHTHSPIHLSLLYCTLTLVS